jgi:RND family efflux transporter MFP subunit
MIACFGALSLASLAAVGQQPSKGGGILSGPDGVLVPWRTCEVACVETGLVQDVLVKTGDRVQVGMLLAELQSEKFRRQLHIAEAQANTLGRIATARAEVELNERKVAAFREARKNEFTTQMELERALADLEIARGRLQSETEEKLVMELRSEHLRQELIERSVVAPIDGIVTEIHKQRGEFVGPNAPEILRIVDVTKLRASFYLSEQEVRSLPVSRKVYVQLASGQTVEAAIENVAPFANAESGLIEINVLVDNSDMDILSSRCTLLIDGQAA